MRTTQLATRAWSWLNTETASSRAAAADVYPHHRTLGIGAEWAPASYGDYIARSPNVYAAITIRQAAVTRVPLVIAAADGTAVAPTHPVATLWETPNPWTTNTELLRKIEGHLCLWGRAFVTNEIVNGKVQLWAIPRPDRMVPLAGSGREYIRAYRYTDDRGGTVIYMPEEVTMIINPNLVRDRTGLSPIAPLRQTLDMNIDALRFNRESLKSGGVPDFLLMSPEVHTTEQVDAFYEAWDKRFGGEGNVHRPAIASGITDVKTMAFSAREMEWMAGMQWGVEEASRVFGVPQPFLGSLREATLANVAALEVIFWRNTMVPETTLIAQKLSRDLLPKLGYPELTAAFDLTPIEVLTEEEAPRRQREQMYLELGVLSINEVREERGLDPIPGGDDRNLPSQRRRTGQPPTPTPAATAQWSAPDPLESASPTPRNGARP